MRRNMAGPALLVALVLTSPAWAYVNGGDFHSNLRDFEKRLKAGGWGWHFTAPLPAGAFVRGEIAGIKVTPDDNADYQRYVNELVGKALKALPGDKADDVPVGDRREVARLAREAIRSAVTDKKEVIKEGRAGSVRYQVGVLAFESYWETNYGGKRELHERRSGLVPFVALKVITE